MHRGWRNLRQTGVVCCREVEMKQIEWDQDQEDSSKRCPKPI